MFIGNDIDDLSDELQLTGEETFSQIAKLMLRNLKKNRIPGVKLRRWFNLCISLPKLLRVWTTMLIIAKYSNYKNVGTDLLKTNKRVHRWLHKYRRCRLHEQDSLPELPNIFNPLT